MSASTLNGSALFPRGGFTVERATRSAAAREAVARRARDLRVEQEELTESIIALAALIGDGGRQS